MKKIMFNDKYGLTDAVLKKIKELTRRLMKNQSGNLTGYIHFTKPGSDLVYVRADFDNGLHEDCPYAIGEIIAVAQAYRYIRISQEYIDNDPFGGLSKGWFNKMFVRADLMPHQIQITDIRAERLQEITEEDCIKEGVIRSYSWGYVKGLVADWEKESHIEYEDGKCYKLFPTLREAFAALIDKISGRGTWDRNPFVWRIEFKLVK